MGRQDQRGQGALGRGRSDRVGPTSDGMESWSRILVLYCVNTVTALEATASLKLASTVPLVGERRPASDFRSESKTGNIAQRTNRPVVAKIGGVQPFAQIDPFPAFVLSQLLKLGSWRATPNLQVAPVDVCWGSDAQGPKFVSVWFYASRISGPADSQINDARSSCRSSGEKLRQFRASASRSYPVSFHSCRTWASVVTLDGRT